MIRVGVIGIGMMGATHLDVYGKHISNARVVAVADLLEERRTGRTTAAGNIQGQAKGGFALASVRAYDEGMKLIADPEVDVVDICLPTMLHARYAIAALEAGKHVLVEKPFARTACDARRIIDAARRSGKHLMCALCMRFWPGWAWLKETVDAKTYGKVLAATFRRTASHPGGPHYSSGRLGGGAILDLHVHDTDFVHYVFGMPEAVTTVGYSKITGEPDHVMTTYHYRGGPMVIAEGSWAMAAGYSFGMQYTVNFEQATAVFDLASPTPLVVYRGGKAEAIALEPGMGYQYEIAYFFNCLAADKPVAIARPEHAAGSLDIIEAERTSVRTGARVKVKSVAKASRRVAAGRPKRKAGAVRR